MKVSIVTIHRIHNYGSVLQTYATQRVFEALGCQAKIIDYITPQRTLATQMKARPSAAAQSGGLKSMLLHGAKNISLVFRQISFGRFIKSCISLTKRYITPEDLENDPPKADLYVTGSDQTWNSKYNEGVDRGFFLDFLPESARRISFVSSFGRESLPPEEREETVRYLRRYSALSVREDSAQRILAELGFDNGVQLIDPTLQLPKEEWHALASGRKVREPYLLLFLLYNEDNGATQYARKLADEHGWKVVKLSWEMKAPAGVDKLMTHRPPEDFLSLMRYAEFVVTNSFHGLAFSINLEKQFIVVPRKEFNSRIESLLRLTGLEDRMVKGWEQLSAAEETIQYAPVRQTLEQERIRAREFLKVQLSFTE